MKRRRWAQSRWRTAVGLSLLAHALAVPWWWGERRRPAPPTPSEETADETPIEIALAEPPPAEAPPEESAQPASPGGPPPRRRAPGRKRATAGSQSEGLPPADRAAAPALPEADTGPGLLRMRAPSLIPSAGELARELGGGAAPPVASGGADEEGGTLAERLTGQLRADQAKRNVAIGRVHPHAYDVLRDARARLDGRHADIQPLGEGRGGFRSFFRSYTEQLKRQGEAEATGLGRAPGGGGVLANQERLRAAARDSADRLRCVVCVEFTVGELPRVKLVGKSGSSTFDRLALEAVTEVAPRRPVPASMGTARACYTLSAAFGTLPPVPGLSCGLDPRTGKPTCAYPFKKLMKLDVEVDSFEPLPGPGG